MYVRFLGTGPPPCGVNGASVAATSVGLSVGAVGELSSWSRASDAGVGPDMLAYRLLKLKEVLSCLVFTDILLKTTTTGPATTWCMPLFLLLSGNNEDCLSVAQGSY